jgi:uncharacterized protein (TIGR02588 family)
MNGASQPAQSRANTDGQQTSSLAEWVTFGIALSIVLAIVGLVVYTWIIKPSAPPIVSVKHGDTWEAQGQFYVPFVVENVGDSTAEAVQVIAELSIDGQVVEDGEQQIDFLSGREIREGAFIFSRDPSQGELMIRVASYKMP